MYIPEPELLQEGLARRYIDLYENGDFPELSSPSLSASSSEWDGRHYMALHAVPIEDVPGESLVPLKHWPSAHDNGYEAMLNDIRAPTPDILKSWSKFKKNFICNPFKPVFDDLAHILVTNFNAKVPFAKEGEDEDSDLSTSSNEGTQQDSPQRALVSFINIILEHADLNAVVEKWTISAYPSCEGFKIPIGTWGKTRTVKNDGGVYLVSAADFTGSDRIAAYLPIISFEAKPRHAGGKKTPSGEPEPFNVKTSAQELAQLLYAASKHHTKYELEYQTSVLFSQHGKRFRVVMVDFSKAYLAAVMNSGSPPRNEHLFVRRSREFNMQEQNDRVEAMKLVLALLQYLHSGDMMIGAIQGFLHSKDHMEE